MDHSQENQILNLNAQTTLTDFYDTLFVQCLLQHSSKRRDAPAHTRSLDRPASTESAWHKFLDHLAFLCDWGRAGKTVASVGAQELDGRVVFRLSARRLNRDQAAIHLGRAIASLRASLELRGDGKLATGRAIASHTIECSEDKVHNYHNRLRDAFKGMDELCGDGPCQVYSKAQLKLTCLDADLVDYIRRNIPSCNQLEGLCSWPYAFRFDAAHRLLRLRLTQQRCERLSSIYHLIGRLGYWHKAAFSLVRNSINFADVLRRATVSLLEVDESGSDPRPRLDRDLESLALRVLPNFRGTALSSALVRSMRSSTDLLNWFGDRSVKCRPHAEAVVTDWFFSTEAKFVDDDRYVGCSKPSCFCCVLYLKLHPAKMRPRPSHGKIWVQWSFPQSPSSVKKVGDRDAETLALVLRMTSEMQLQIRESVTTASHIPAAYFYATRSCRRELSTALCLKFVTNFLGI